MASVIRNSKSRFIAVSILAAVGVLMLFALWKGADTAMPGREEVAPVERTVPAPDTRERLGTVDGPDPEAPPGGTAHGEAVGRDNELQEEIWEDFAYPAVLSREVNGRTVHKVANHLVITERDGDVSGLLDAWASGEPGRFVHTLAVGTYLVGWSETSAEAHASHRTVLAEHLRGAAVVEPDWIVRTASVPNDPLYHTLQRHFDVIFAPEGWAVRTDAREIVVAVLDTGVERTHPDLVNRVRARPGEIPGTGVDNDGNGFIDDVFGWDFVDGNNDPSDPAGHGTHVAGLIGAEGDNGLWGTGVAWDVTLLPVRFLDHNGVGTTSDEIRALDYARVSGARIVNASYGGPGFSEGVLARLRALEDAGIWVVAAAGNDGADIDSAPVYPAAHDSDNIISVGAGDPERGKAGFSNFGRNSVDLFAPGSGIFSIEPNGRFPSRSGTSFSTALVTGALALVVAEYPNDPMSAVRSRIVDRVRFSSALAGQSRSEGVLDLGHALAPGPGRPPEITRSPESALLLPRVAATLVVEAVSSAGTTVQWLRNGEPIPGATNFHYSIYAFTGHEEGTYQARVTDVFGVALSAPAEILLDRRPPSIVRMPRAASFVPGGELRLLVEVESAVEVDFQWFFNGEPISGATSPELVIPSGRPEDAGEYFLRASNPYGSVDSKVIPVGFGPVSEDAWETVLQTSVKVSRREGDYYLATAPGQLLVSRDLFSWEPLPRGGRAFAYLGGEYFLLDRDRRLFRGDSLAGLEPWVETGLPVVDNYSIVKGNGHLLVQALGERPYLLIDLASGEMSAAEPPDSVPFSRITSGAGAFWTGSTSAGLWKSGDGVAWAEAPGPPILPIHEDGETGWVVGKVLASSASGERLYLRRPGGDWEILDSERNILDAWVANDLRAIFPGGCVVARDFGGWRVDFHSGELHPVSGNFSNDRRRPLFTWYDNERSLSWKEESGTDVLVLEEFTDGSHWTLFPGSGRESVPTLSGSTLFSLGNTVFRHHTDHGIFRVDSSGRHHRVETPELGLHFVGSNGREAVFVPQWGDDTRVFRLDADARLSYRMDAGFEEPIYYWGRRGTGFIARETFPPPVADGEPLWLSADGIDWEVHEDLPFTPDQVVRGPGAWVAVFFDSGDGDRRVRVLCRPDATRIWEDVLELSLPSGVPSPPGTAVQW